MNLFSFNDTAQLKKNITGSYQLSDSHNTLRPHDSHNYRVPEKELQGCVTFKGPTQHTTHFQQICIQNATLPTSSANNNAFKINRL